MRDFLLRLRWHDVLTIVRDLVTTVVHGVVTLMAVVFDGWFWVTHGFRVPRYIHVMALMSVMIGGWLWSIVPADAPVRNWGTFGPVFFRLSCTDSLSYWAAPARRQMVRATAVCRPGPSAFASGFRLR